DDFPSTESDAASTADPGVHFQDQALNNVISSEMNIYEMFKLLMANGCCDMTPYLDKHTCSEYPVANGGYGDVFRARLFRGDEVAIKTVRMFDDLSFME
ncbi:hypothetical protein FRC11_007537, partial [Ceratobasidium sp. 423]